MGKFTFPKRYDEKEAKDGIWFDIYDEHEQHWGTYKMALFNITAPHVKQAIAAWNRKHKKEIETRKFKGNEGIIRAFVDIALLDWKNTEMLNGGKALPFSKETAYALLSDEDASFLSESLIDFAGNVRNFAGEPEADQEDDAKNSSAS